VSDHVYDAVFHLANALELPVVILTLLALAVVIVEIGAFVAELNARRRRRADALAAAAERARAALRAGDGEAAAEALRAVAWSGAMERTLDAFVTAHPDPAAEARIAKQLADFDLGRQGRLGRTRLLVRVGPALGLMGTLIPLSPALDGLARGNVHALTDNLRVAFSVTVLGLFIGSLAFALSLVRDRLYGQDLSDLEFVAALITAESPT
jgi:biopolymer transport protein ExbB/TolQ